MNKKKNVSEWLPNLSVHSGSKYMALADTIEQAIKDGLLSTGDKLSTHRWLADSLGVTVCILPGGTLKQKDDD